MSFSEKNTSDAQHWQSQHITAYTVVMAMPQVIEVQFSASGK